MLKKLLIVYLILIVTGCDDSFENSFRYSKIITQSKSYPVYLDNSELGKIKVRADMTMISPFKVLANNKYYFIGDRLKGIHIYEKHTNAVKFRSFIECFYLKDFELIGDILYLNNLTDLIVLDVSNPQEPSVLQRRENYFNRYSSFKESWNIPYESGKGFMVGSETYDLTGVVTNEKPDLDFSEYDELYGQLTTEQVPNFWFREHPQYDKPYVGMVKVNSDEIYAYGSYNSWFINTFQNGYLSVKEHDLWTTPKINYAPPYYFSNAFPFRMFFEDDIIFILGAEDNLMKGYSDCILYNEMFPETQHLYFSTFVPVDICFMPSLNTFFVLSGTSVWGVFISGNGVTGYECAYMNYEIDTDAVEIVRVGEKLITIGSELSVYSVNEREISLDFIYPGISGQACYKDGNMLAVVSLHGLFLYDISDLSNIQLIQ